MNTTTHSIPASHAAETSPDEREFLALAQAYFRRHGAAAALALLHDMERMVADMVPR